jgi:hypothetical protein
MSKQSLFPVADTSYGEILCGLNADNELSSRRSCLPELLMLMPDHHLRIFA